MRDKVEDISAIASGEFTIDQTLKEIINLWNETHFVVVNYREMKDRYILGSIEEIMIQLEDHQVSI